MNYKELNVSILEKFGFKVIHREMYRVYMDLEKPNDSMNNIQAVVFANYAHTYSVDIHGGFLAPVYENEELFINHLNKYFPGWR